MDEKIEEVIEKYPITVKNKKRIRGAILFEAEEGLFVLTKHKDNKQQIAFQEEVKADLQRQGFSVDLGVKNEEGNRAKSAAVSVYESTPLSYASKGKELEFKKGQIFIMNFKLKDEEEEQAIEDKPNYTYEIENK